MYMANKRIIDITFYCTYLSLSKSRRAIPRPRRCVRGQNFGHQPIAGNIIARIYTQVLYWHPSFVNLHTTMADAPDMELPELSPLVRECTLEGYSDTFLPPPVSITPCVSARVRRCHRICSCTHPCFCFCALAWGLAKL